MYCVSKVRVDVWCWSRILVGVAQVLRPHSLLSQSIENACKVFYTYKDLDSKVCI